MLDPKNLAIAKTTIDAFCIAVSLDFDSNGLWTKANEIRKALSMLDMAGWRLYRELLTKESRNEMQKASTL